jgi:prepilin-type N-terminal cleavage/methylation domain-containing protein
MKTYTHSKQGFTLIELLLVIAVISALAVTVFVALNPAQRLKDGRDGRRQTDVETILSAIHTSIVDNKGTLPAGLTAGMVEKQLGTAVTGCAIATGGCTVAGATDCVNLTTPLAAYLKSMPLDPNGGTAALSKYSVIVDANGIVTVRACGTEGASNISTSR